MNNICFAHSEITNCTALKVKKCPGDRCPFFMTPEQQIESRQKAYKRLFRLDRVMQVSIASTFYSGKMPWLEGGERSGC